MALLFYLIVLFISFLFAPFVQSSEFAQRERDVWSIGNVELKPDASPAPDLKFSFWRKLHPDCAKSKVNPAGCMIPEDQRISNKTCAGAVMVGSGDFQICTGVKNVQKGSVRWRLKKGSYVYKKGVASRMVIEIVRKEEIHE